MNETILNGKKNGIAVLIAIIAGYAVAIFALVLAMATESVVLLIPSILYIALAWILLMGLKSLKPQEALVLTLFGKYN